MGDEHVVQPRPMIFDELQLAIQAIGRFEDGRQGLLGRFDPDIQAVSAFVIDRSNGRLSC